MTFEQVMVDLVGKMPSAGGVSLEERTEKVISDLIFQDRLEILEEKKKKGGD